MKANRTIQSTLASNRKAIAATLAAKEKQRADAVERIDRVTRELQAARDADEQRTRALAGEIANGEEGILARIGKKFRAAGITSPPTMEIVEAGLTLLRRTVDELDAEISELRERIQRTDQAIARVRCADMSWDITARIATLHTDVSELNRLHAAAGKSGPFLPVARCDDPLGWQRIAAGFARQDARSRHDSMRAQSVAWWRTLGHDCGALEQTLDADKGDDLPRAQAALETWIKEVTQPAQPAPSKEQIA